MAKKIITVLFAFGTRPEALKMAPLITAMKKRRSTFKVLVCVTGQHRQMLDQVLTMFSIRPDFDLNLMRKEQSLSSLTANIIGKFDQILTSEKPDLLVVQGDTTTTFACSLAAFYRQIRVAHVEAGLRTDDCYSPFPEEINRRMTSLLTFVHYAPTERAKKLLIGEGFSEDRVILTGNTVIDTLLEVEKAVADQNEFFSKNFSFIKASERVVLITGHRRESFGEGFKSICDAVKKLANAYPNIRFIYSVHLNPNVSRVVYENLGGLNNVTLIPPQPYTYFVWLMKRSYLVMTDSGGIQEEAPSLGKPIIIMREKTERMEAVEAGVALLVGTNTEIILKETNRLLTDKDAYEKMALTANPFGDGTASKKIVNHLASLDF